MAITNNWNKINWKKYAVSLSALQYEILIAFREGNTKLITKLQYELTRSFAARAMADDFVVLGKSVEELREIARPVTEEFLSLRGLELHPEKTGICTIKDGSDFLRYHF